jgi:hypothetical protein
MQKNSKYADKFPKYAGKYAKNVEICTYELKGQNMQKYAR